jgi:hypothetical protein
VAGKTTILEWRSNLSGALSGLGRLDARVTQGFAEKRSALGWYLSAFQAEERTPADGADFFDTLFPARNPINAPAFFSRHLILRGCRRAAS